MRGPAALEEALDQAVGAAHRRADLVVKSDSSPGAWRKFGDLIIAVAAVLQIATSSLMLPGQIRQELEGPPPASPAVVKVVVEPPGSHDLLTPLVQHGAEKVTESPGSG